MNEFQDSYKLSQLYKCTMKSSPAMSKQSDGCHKEVHINTGANNIRKLCVLGGDLNARLGNRVKDLLGGDILDYRVIDEGQNTNGKIVRDICVDSDLAVINNLVTNNACFQSALTYRQRQRWVSEPDMCLVSRELIGAIKHLRVNQDLRFPSDHAPLSVTLDFCKTRLGAVGLAELVERARLLGSYPDQPATASRKAIRYRHFDHNSFRREMCARNPPPIVSLDGLAEIQLVTDTMYECSESSLV